MRKARRAKVRAIKSLTDISGIRWLGGPDCRAWGHALEVGVAIGTRSHTGTTDRPCGKVPRRSWGSGRGFSRWDGGANAATMIPRRDDR